MAAREATVDVTVRVRRLMLRAQRAGMNGVRLEECVNCEGHDSARHQIEAEGKWLCVARACGCPGFSANGIDGDYTSDIGPAVEGVIPL